MNEPEPDAPIDLDGLSFANLRDRKDQAIARSIRQLLDELDELDEPQDAVAGFQPAI